MPSTRRPGTTMTTPDTVCSPQLALRPGEAVRIPSGVRHWHGAGSRIAASHLALNAPGPTAWGTPVTPEEYALAAGAEGA